jgi:4,5:9,10-diseco-3-hydroxy-5,9,17-trioxoandrosta-1(10),2-diene-4-oate hydrolase
VTTDLTFDGTSQAVKAAGREVHYHEAGDGPVLLLLHGSGPGVSGWSNFGRNMPVFAEHFRTVVMDMPGFGRTAMGTLDCVYPKYAAKVAWQFLDALDIEGAHILGNSMGGYVGAEMALAEPTRAHKLVMMGPGGLSVNLIGPRESEGWLRLMEFLGAPSRQGMVAWLNTMVADRAIVTEELIEERMTMAMQDGVIEAAIAIFSSFGQFPDPTPPWTRAATLTNPTLITWGRDDRMMPLEGGLLGYRQLPNAELHVFANCGHWAQVERKGEFERVVLEFLSREAS